MRPARRAGCSASPYAETAEEGRRGHASSPALFCRRTPQLSVGFYSAECPAVFQSQETALHFNSFIRALLFRKASEHNHSQWKGRLKSIFFREKQNCREAAPPNRNPARRVRFGKEEQRRECALTNKTSRSKRYKACSDVAQREGFEPSWDCSQTDFESLEAGVFWSILSDSLRLSERRKPLILLGVPSFSLSAQGFGNFSCQSRFSGKV